VTIGGFRVSLAQYKVLYRLRKQGQVAYKSVNTRTGYSLKAMGLVEIFVPDAATYSMAARGRVRYYRLTTAGKEAIDGLRRMYHKELKEDP
jgi:DNA-binding MarR family transcriptional regulator